MNFKMPPDGTTTGYRLDDGSMWLSAEHDGKPAIAICVFPGNLLTPPSYLIIATFETVADRDFVLALHRAAVVEG